MAYMVDERDEVAEPAHGAPHLRHVASAVTGGGGRRLLLRRRRRRRRGVAGGGDDDGLGEQRVGERLGGGGRAAAAGGGGGGGGGGRGGRDAEQLVRCRVVAAGGDVGEVEAAVVRPGEAVDVAEAAAAALRPPGLVGEQAEQRGGARRRVVRVHQQPVAQHLEDVHRPAVLRRHYRQPICSSLHTHNQ